MVYCESDLAKLCLQCDTCVHSANPLSCRHPRSLVCDRCNSQPATVRCMDDKLSFCQGCDWNGCSGSGHRLQKLNAYTGCSSIDQFSSICPSLLEMPYPSACDSSFTPMAGSVMVNDSSINSCLEHSPNECSSVLVDDANRMNELSSSIKFEDIVGPSTVVPLDSNYVPQCSLDQPSFLPAGEGLNLSKVPFLPAEEGANLPKVSFLPADEGPNLPKTCSSLKNIILGQDDDPCKGVDLDVALNFECGYEMFGCSQDQSKFQSENGGLDCLVLEKPVPIMESNNMIENTLETASSSQQDCITFQSPQVNGPAMMQAMSNNASCMIMDPSCNNNIGFPFPTGPLSLTTITEESKVTDYQDCLSPAFLAGESPWESTLETSSPQARDKAKMRYNEKKKTRMFGKQIRYASRKARADTRKRVKGRFVKAGEAYDYDPLGKRIL
ncbi:hypothetical protein AgCh_002994 [Apium graveolens]